MIDFKTKGQATANGFNLQFVTFEGLIAYYCNSRLTDHFV